MTVLPLQELHPEVGCEEIIGCAVVIGCEEIIGCDEAIGAEEMIGCDEMIGEEEIGAGAGLTIVVAEAGIAGTD